MYKRVRKNVFTHKEFVIRIPGVGALRLTLFRLVWRTLYVVFTTGKQLHLLLFVIRQQCACNFSSCA